MIQTKTDVLQELIEVAKLCRETCAACFRVIAHHENVITELEAEMARAGIETGFGKRLQEAITAAEAKLKSA